MRRFLLSICATLFVLLAPLSQGPTARAQGIASDILGVIEGLSTFGTEAANLASILESIEMIRESISPVKAYLDTLQNYANRVDKYKEAYHYAENVVDSYESLYNSYKSAFDMVSSYKNFDGQYIQNYSFILNTVTSTMTTTLSKIEQLNHLVTRFVKDFKHLKKQDIVDLSKQLEDQTAGLLDEISEEVIVAEAAFMAAVMQQDKDFLEDFISVGVRVDKLPLPIQQKLGYIDSTREIGGDLAKTQTQGHNALTIAQLIILVLIAACMVFSFARWSHDPSTNTASTFIKIGIVLIGGYLIMEIVKLASGINI